MNPCLDLTEPGTLEEQRLEGQVGHGPVGHDASVADDILARTGLDQHVRGLVGLLCGWAPQDDPAALGAAVERAGARLWAAAVRRAHLGEAGDSDATSSLPADALPPLDDRGLYWARLAMVRMLRRWRPAAGLEPAARAALIRRLEYASRGITRPGSPSGATADRVGTPVVVVTGFDPFGLDPDRRTGNPSGSVALSLDGQAWTVRGRQVLLRALILPVRYADFDAGIVEDALRGFHEAGPGRARLVLTVSQGRAGAFDLEVFNGRRRAVQSRPDNLGVWGGGTRERPVVAPGMPDGPEFLATSLPVEAMVRVELPSSELGANTHVVEIPAGQHAPVERPHGPTPGSTACLGGGGGYLSNEVAYRNTLLREGLDSSVPAGHLHVPAPAFGPGNACAVTDSAYESARDAVVTGTHALLRAGLEAGR